MADVLTEGAFSTIQWKSLMQLFDVHPPPQLNVDPESSCSAVSQQTPLVMSTACSSQREKPEDSSHGVCSGWKHQSPEQSGPSSSVWETLWFIPQTLLLETHCVLRKQEAQKPTLFGKKFVKAQSSMGQKTQKKVISKPCGRASDRQLSLPLSYRVVRQPWPSASSQTRSGPLLLGPFSVGIPL